MSFESNGPSPDGARVWSSRSARASRLGLRLAALALIVVGVCFAPSALALAADVDRDGTVDVIDLQLVVNLILQQTQPVYPGQGDVDENNNLSVVDVQWVANTIIGISPSALTIATSASIAPARRDETFSLRLAAVRGVPPIAWSYTGNLPPGIRVLADGRIAGTPTAEGQYSYTIVVSDGAANFDSKVFGQVILPPNRAPVANPDSYAVLPASTLNVPAPGVLLNDTDPDNDPLTVTILGLPQYGTVNLNMDGSFSYSTTAGNGITDTFSYTVQDGQGGSAIGMVTITVGDPPPIAMDDAYTTLPGTLLFVPAPGVLGNDVEPNQQQMAASLASPPLFGTVIVHAAGSFNYTPITGFDGIDRFAVGVTDGSSTVYSTVYIRVGDPLAVGELAIIHADVSPNPVKAGEPAVLRLLVEDGLSALPAVSNIASASADAAVLGLPGPVTLAASAYLNANVSVLTAQVTVPASATYGLHEVEFSVTNLQTTTASTKTVFGVYTGAAIRVGTGRPITTIIIGIQAASPGDAVLVDPATYVGNANSSLTLNKDIFVAGHAGALRTVIDAQGVGSQFVAIGPSRSAILLGLTLKGAAMSAVRATLPFSVAQCVFRENTHLGNGGAINATQLANVLVRECVFRDNRVGNIIDNGTDRGGAIAINNGARADVIDSIFVGNWAENRGWCHGGAVYLHQTGALISEFQRCFFLANESRGAQYGQGGAISGYQQANYDVISCRFRLNRALGVMAPGLGGGETPNPPTTVGRGVGGALFVTETAKGRVVDCVFDRNSAEGLMGGTGGAVAARFDGAFSLHACAFTENFTRLATPITTNTNAVSEGGAINADLRSSINALNCSFDGDYCDFAPVHCRGGAVFGNTSSAMHFERCSFTGHSAFVRGGAMAFETNSCAVLDQCTISECVAGSLTANYTFGVGGGAIYVGNNCGVQCENSTFHGNLGESLSTGGGGVILCGGILMPATTVPAAVNVRFINCLMTDNIGRPFGGVALKHADTSTGRRPLHISFENCTAEGNSAQTSGAFLSMANGHTGAVNGSIVWDNAPSSIVAAVPTSVTVGNSCVGPLVASVTNYAGSNGNVAGPPLFVTGPRGHYYLQNPGSPCIDVGPSTGLVPAPVLVVTSTSVLDTPDTGIQDMGYHYFITNYTPVSLATLSGYQYWQAYCSPQTVYPPLPLEPFLPMP